MRRRVALLALAVAVVGAAVAVAIVIHNRNADRAERAARRALVARLEQDITRGARRLVARHRLRGPILRTVCLHFEDFDPDDLSVKRGRYSCTAVRFQFRGAYTGPLFVGVVDFRHRRVVRWYPTSIPLYLGV